MAASLSVAHGSRGGRRSRGQGEIGGGSGAVGMRRPQDSAAAEGSAAAVATVADAAAFCRCSR
jgi:hypothetical protein